MTLPPKYCAPPNLLTSIMRCTNTVLSVVVALYFFLIPGCLVLHYISDPALGKPAIPKVAWRLHRSLTPRYEQWARARIASGKAAHLHLYDVPSTEWPMFGSVFYLQATENLQNEWERDNTLSRQSPAVYARETIETAADVLVDPVHHTWVKTHWGTNYMHRENVFFRAMIIAGLTSREKLLKDGKHANLLRDQVETLAADLDNSKYGLLHDYPNECYPVDVFAAVTAIRRADPLLGTDHSAFVSRALRAFQPPLLDERGMVPYLVDLYTGSLDQPSRGIGNSYILAFAPFLYPEQAHKWYDLYVDYFWQERIGAAGFREYPRDIPGRNWFFDVDAGPVIAGYSPAGNAYAVAASRANGRMDHARTVGSQVLAAAWPLPDGSLFGGRILSTPGADHAPYLGEANLLWLFTVQPPSGITVVSGGYWPPLVYVGFLFYFGIGGTILAQTIIPLLRWKKRRASYVVPFQRTQFTVWLILLAGGGIIFIAGMPIVGAIPILISLCLPRIFLREP